MTDYRDLALELVEIGVVDAENLLTACLKYMSQADVEHMLDLNELSEHFTVVEDDDLKTDPSKPAYIVKTV